MGTVHRISRPDARRIAVRAQLLTSQRPADLLAVVRRLSALQLDPVRDRRRLRALGIARAVGTQLPGEPSLVGEAGEPAEVEGTRGQWRVDPSYLDGLAGPFDGRAALLSPFDRIVHDRGRAADIFEFEYQRG